MRLSELIHIPATIQSVWSHRQLLWQWTRRLLAVRYAGSLLGPLWTLVTPLFMLTIYTFVFGVVFHARWQTLGTDMQTTDGYALILFCGMAAFQLFAETVGTASRCIIDNVNLVKKVIFPLHILPVAQMLAATVTSLIWFALTLGGALLIGQGIPVTALLFPLTLIPLMAFALGIGWLVAALAVYLRDIPNLVTLLLQGLFFLTPIFYPEDMVPESWRLLLTINPLTHLCRQTRELLIFGQVPPLPTLLATWFCCFLIFQLGFVWFSKAQRGFADVL